VFIEHPLENSMAYFDFTSAMLDQGTTFIFGSWICIANGSGGFNNHLAKTSKLEALQQPDAAISMSSSTTLMRCCSPSCQGDREDVHVGI
jgi:hypothetical protein